MNASIDSTAVPLQQRRIDFRCGKKRWRTGENTAAMRKPGNDQQG